MAAPLAHATSSVKRWGGVVEDYIHIHQKMDCSKKYMPDNRHRAATHNHFWIYEVMIPLFGEYITISTGRQVPVKNICELHIMEDYRMKFIPTLQDWLQEIPLQNWMQNGFKDLPTSASKANGLKRGTSQNEEPVSGIARRIRGLLRRGGLV
jgi:hypothetical protein